MIRRTHRRRNTNELTSSRGGEAAAASPLSAGHANGGQGALCGRNTRPAWTLAAPVQARLAVGPVDDPLEREADAMADQVTTSLSGAEWMRMPDGVAPPAQLAAAPADRRLPVVRRDAPAARPATEAERREFEAMRREFEARRTEFFGMVGEQMGEDILGRAGFTHGAGGSQPRPTTAEEALQVTTMWGVTRDVLVAALPNLGQALQGSVRGAHGSDTLAARQQALIDAMTPDGQQGYRDAIATLRREPFWANYLDTTTVFIFPDLSGANRYAGYTQRGTERDAEGNETRAFIVHISKDALEAGNLAGVVTNLVHELSHTLDQGATLRPALDPLLDELAGLLADHPDVQALRQGAPDASEARATHVRRISQILYEHTGYGEAEVFAHLQQLTHQPSVDVGGQQVSGSRYILGTIEGYIRQLMGIGINPRTLDNLLDALGRRTAILYDRRIEATPAGSTQRQRLQREKEIAELTLRVARDLAREEPVQPKLKEAAHGGEGSELQRLSAAGGLAPASVHGVLRSPGRPLDPATRAWVEPRFGRDFGEVRVHADPGAARSAEAIGARAYTSGRHIAFAANQYAPHTPAGLRLLSHELGHVVQQGQAPPAAQTPAGARWPVQGLTHRWQQAPASSRLQRQPAPEDTSPSLAGSCRIHFVKARAEFIDAKEFARCMRLVHEYLTSAPGSTVELHGFASEEGSEEFNQRLSQQRADIVKLLLGQGNVPRDRIETFAHGRDATYGTPEENRRVEIALGAGAGLVAEEKQPFAPHLPEPEPPEKPPGPKRSAPQALETFCTPFASKALAMKAHKLTKKILMDFTAKFGGDVQDLWRTYMDTPKVGTKGTLPSRRVFSDQQGRVVKEFREDPETLEQRDLIVNKLLVKLSDHPSLIPPEGESTEFQPLRMLLQDKDLMDLPMRFTDPTERIPGLIAGGFGKNNSDAGDDVRNADGQFSVTNLGLGMIRLHVASVFDIVDAVDFCPGAPGSLIAQLGLTDDLSRLEATPDVPTYDTPFEVVVGASDVRDKDIADL